MSGPNESRVLRAWGANPPEWVKVLAERCDKSSQAEVAREIDRSAAVVNQVLGRSYIGRIDTVEQLVRGRYMKATVICPVLGEISTNECLDNQAKAKRLRAVNPLRVRLFNACKSCPNRDQGREDPCSKSSSK